MVNLKGGYQRESAIKDCTKDDIHKSATTKHRIRRISLKDCDNLATCSANLSN